MAKTFETNFDGLVGPTHNYSGLSSGNIASTLNRAQISNPLEAVLQGLEKMKKLSDLGLKQGVLPPQERPQLAVLRTLGFEGSDEQILQKTSDHSSDLLSAVYSSSSMWAANAATVSPSADTEDRKVHFTPANLVSKFHRFLEPSTTSALLKAIFKNSNHFVHHDPLPSAPHFGDEGAANHTRLCDDYDKPGIEFFVYGRQSFLEGGPAPRHFVARQTYEASQAIARLHRLDSERVIYAQQNPDAIDAGVFHNDVVGVGNQNVYFYHEQSFLDPDAVLKELNQKYKRVGQKKLHLIQVPASKVSLQDAVKSYLFNSQLISLPSNSMADTGSGMEANRMVLVLPKECETTPSVASYLKTLLSEQSDLLHEALYFDLKQSMCNGGGPACLRLRVALTQEELAAVQPKTLMTSQLYSQLVSWAKKHYRDRLSLDDLRDSKLLIECRTALDELTMVLGLGSVYSFQKK